jgi:glyoxylase-like metal-dependent hydrolase (beta-lactamase superfamily II)
MVFVIERCAFTGDVIFKQSIGRTDFLGSDANEMKQSLLKLKKMLPSEMKVLPGHGEESYMSYENETNPFLSRL